jgi:hypothetical protein
LSSSSSSSSESDISLLEALTREAERELNGKPSLTRQNAILTPAYVTQAMDQEGGEEEPHSYDLPLSGAVDATPSSSSEEPEEVVTQRPDWFKQNDRSMARFRLEGKSLYLTYPKCDVPKETVMANIKLLPDLAQAIVAHEKHADGSSHLHCYIFFNKQIRKYGFKWLDELANGHHGNYQTCRSKLAVIRYVTKDGDYISFGIDPTKYLKQVENHEATRKVTDEFAIMMKEKPDLTIDDLDDINPAWVFRNKRKAEEYLLYQATKRAKTVLNAWPTLDPTGLTGHNLRICKWLIKNIRVARSFKQKQLYIHGPANKGKTHLLECLSQYLAIYPIPKSTFVDGYEDNRFDLAVMDEFKAHLTVQFLNEFLQGSNMVLNQKGKMASKRQNIPVIILSNFSLEECYSKKTNVELAALKCRLKIVEITDSDERINIPFPSLH